MPLIIGIDEAGYGPLLGPLVLGATIWHTPDPCDETHFWKKLNHAITPTYTQADWRLPIGDSKKIYDRKRGLHTLERSVLAFIAAAGQPCDTLQQLLSTVGADLTTAARTIPWYRNLNRKLPTDPTRATYDGVLQRLTQCLAAAQLSCQHCFAEIVTEDAYNNRVKATRNKAALLIEKVLRLITRATDGNHDHAVEITIDRLGGRHNYRLILQQAFPDHQLREIEISPISSRYELANGKSQWIVSFTIDADQQHLPVALASMLAKYLRELLMHEFNRFWRQYQPNLKPTAGYYKDAQRFIRDIQPLARSANLDPASFIRLR